MARLAGRAAVITGAAGGIGLAAAQLFASEGARVLLVDIDEAALRHAAAQVDGAPGWVVADVADAQGVERYVNAAVERLGGFDILVLNAGIEGVVQPIPDYPVNVFDKVIAVNVRGVWLGLKYGMAAMKKHRGGSIVITSSVAGLQGAPNMSAYVASKHAAVGLMRTAALEGAADGIRVNTVNPAPIETRMMRSLEEGFAPGSAKAAKANFSARIPLRRYGTPEEVANLMLFLASDESRFCTGGVYSVDGGRSAT